MKIRPVRAALFHTNVRTDETSSWTEGQIDMTKLIVGFRSFVNAPKKRTHYTPPPADREGASGIYHHTYLHTIPIGKFRNRTTVQNLSVQLIMISVREWQ